jgi:hypothetical protein
LFDFEFEIDIKNMFIKVDSDSPDSQNNNQAKPSGFINHGQYTSTINGSSSINMNGCELKSLANRNVSST